jgi:rare lipoprotein A
MLLKNNKIIAFSGIGLILVGCASAGFARRNSSPISESSVVPPENVLIGDPYTIGGQRFEPKDDATFDETGYALLDGLEREGQVTTSGEPYNPEAITASHRTLPIPSYAEVTDLATGRTILVRVVDRGPMRKDKVTSLSPGAARQLGVEGQSNLAVRFRRTSPVFEEKVVLRQGRSAPVRLDTPPALLSALRRRLGETSGKPVDLAVAPPPVSAPSKPMVTRPLVRPKPPVTARPPVTAGADFDVPSGVARPPERPSRPTPAPNPRGNDRFVVEQAGKPHWIEGAGAPNREPPGTIVSARPSPAPMAPKAMAPLFVQIASFSSESRARALAQQTGASVVQAGSVYRVRKGPYSDDASARAALGQVVAKGYRGAVISH